MGSGDSRLDTPGTPTVLTIDDEPSILRLYRLELATAGMAVVPATTTEAGLAVLESQHIDIVVLDLLLSGTPGMDTLVAIKKRWPALPVIIVTADSSPALRSRAVEAGADDLVHKPFSPEDLTARIRFLLGVAAGAVVEEEPIRIGNVQIELRRERVMRHGEPVTFSRTEWMLLRRLVAANGDAALDQELLVKTWGSEYRTDVGFLHLWIDRLRRKLGDDPRDPRMIRRFQGVGYRFTAEQQVEPPV